MNWSWIKCRELYPKMNGKSSCGIRYPKITVKSSCGIRHRWPYSDVRNLGGKAWKLNFFWKSLQKHDPEHSWSLVLYIQYQSNNSNCVAYLSNVRIFSFSYAGYSFPRLWKHFCLGSLPPLCMLCWSCDLVFFVLPLIDLSQWESLCVCLFVTAADLEAAKL